MEAVLIVFIIFGSITIWVRGFPSFVSAFRGRRGERELRKQLEVSTQQLHRLQAENASYEERLQTLEGIVCDVDHELNRKLARLATAQLALPPADPRPTARGGEAERESPALLGARDSGVQESLAPQSQSTGVLGAGVRIADRFVVEAPLGSGAMGEVYLAYDETLDETVALKVLAGVSLADADAVERFRREATAARRITHPNVVRMHDIGVDRGVHFISMEYVRGESLRQRLDREVALDLDVIRDLTVQVCEALQAAHDAGVVHRDLKPDNILIDRQGRARVIDFGVAKLPQARGMTATGVIMGTPEYMAPEQVLAKPVDGRTDLYSLGAILFHLLAGSPPFKGDNPIAIAYAQCNEPAPPLEEYRDLPAAWTRLVARALAKQPAERFESAARMREELLKVPV
ncbi:MAG: serine/threonine-protein kinase [Myxococcales bacterium]|jgi:serine/threonine-protein kinase